MFAEKMLGHTLVTKQTGPAGKPCNAVYVCERKYVRREFYFAVLMDRATKGPVVVASSQGGVDIESVAAENPDAILKVPVDLDTGFQMKEARELAQKLGFSHKATESAADMMVRLYKVFIDKDATMVEINPMAESAAGEGIK